MKRSALISMLFLPLLLFSCGQKKIDVLVLGNSITHHVPDESIGWKGNWGMAATSADKDFESVLTAKLKEHFGGSKISLTAKNIAVWEQDFNYDLKQFPDIANQKYDIIIIRLGENVDEKSANFANYETSLNELINQYKNDDTIVLITGTVWSSPTKDAIQKKVADDNKYYYIPMLPFQANPKNYATGQFENEQVAAHPSDFGMNTIAEMIFEQIKLLY